MTTDPRAGAPPGKQNGRPHGGRSEAATRSAINRDSVQANTDESAFRDGYGLGFGTGWQVGYAFAYNEQGELDDRRMARMHDIATTPAYRDLERVRWDGERKDFGLPRPGDFPGMGADYEPQKYYVPLHPGSASAHRRERGAA